MFELLRLGGTPERSIVVETRLRTSIPNSQAPEPDDRLRRVFARLVASHPAWEVRRAACGVYNCFGHVWAGRRTAIYEPSGVNAILGDDGYRKLAPSEAPFPGDIALYLTADGNILHAAEVVEIRRLSTPVGLGSGTPYALSKLNDSTGEVLHHLKDVPWEDANVEIWTERPHP